MEARQTNFRQGLVGFGNKIHLKDKDRTEVTMEKYDGTYEKSPDKHLGTFTSDDLEKRYKSNTLRNK